MNGRIVDVDHQQEVVSNHLIRIADRRILDAGKELPDIVRRRGLNYLMKNGGVGDMSTATAAIRNQLYHSRKKYDRYRRAPHLRYGDTESSFGSRNPTWVAPSFHTWSTEVLIGGGRNPLWEQHTMHPELVLSIVLFQIKLHLVLQLGFGIYKTISKIGAVA